MLKKSSIVISKKKVKDSNYQPLNKCSLPIALAQVKAGNTSENLLNEIKQITCFFYQAEEITKKLYNNTMNSMKL